MNGLQFLALAIACAVLFIYATNRNEKTMTKNTNPVLDLYRSDAHDSTDPWGSALNAQFDIAECLHRHGADVPAEWQFSPGLAAQHDLDTEDASWFALEIEEMMLQGHYSNLVHAGTVLMRYVAQCELAGKSY